MSFYKIIKYIKKLKKNNKIKKKKIIIIKTHYFLVLYFTNEHMIFDNNIKYCRNKIFLSNLLVILWLKYVHN